MSSLSRDLGRWFLRAAGIVLAGAMGVFLAAVVMRLYLLQ